MRNQRPAGSASRVERGFTLIEVMVVIVILGILATIVVPNVIGTTDEARSDAAKIQVIKLQEVVETFYVKNARMPEDWQQLIEKDSTGNSYLKAEDPPVDPWGNEFVLQRGDRANQCLIVSFGPDGVQGTEDDITSENARKRAERR